MKYQGKITSWNDDRGFGFIEPHASGKRAFVHISAFSQRGRRPTVGDVVTYELTKDGKGRPKAEHVAYPGAKANRQVGRPEPGFLWRRVVTIGILSTLAIAAYLHYQPGASFFKRIAQSPMRSTAITPHFQCEGKTRCSQMSSCGEARFYLNHCPGTQMDGDGDGVPCEAQWCGH